MDYYLLPLLKAENPEAYKKLAERGIMVAHPVKINGQDKRSDNGIPFHSTIKFFNPDADHPHQIHHIARGLELNPPDPKTTQIEPDQFKDRLGNDVFVLKLKGNDAEKIKEHNGKFAHMGYPASYEFTPHVSIPKDLHDKIKASGAKTAHEAGIEFGPAELRMGHKVLKRYNHPVENRAANVEQHDPIISTERDHKKLAASEKEDINLNKNAIKNAGIALGMAGALATSPHNLHSATMTPQDQYSSSKMLNAISQVESSGGKNTHHAAMGGMHNGSHSYGKYGLSPEIIHETISLNPELKAKYGKALALKGDTVHKFMHDNKGLEDQIAQKHLARLEHHFGKDPETIGFAWNQGISGTNKALKSGKDIKNHWHTQKIKNAYIGEEGKI